MADCDVNNGTKKDEASVKEITSNRPNRKRTRTDRYTSSQTTNGDHHFDESLSDTEISDSSSKQNASDFEMDQERKDIEMKKVDRNCVHTAQLSRIEARVQIIDKMVQKMERILISINNKDIEKTKELLPKLPVNTVEELNDLESHLAQSSARSNLINHLTTINGVNGSKHPSTILKSIVTAIIEANVLKQYTWTGGRGTMENSSLCFSAKANIFDVVFETVKAYNDAYTRSACESHMKTKVFKSVRKQM